MEFGKKGGKIQIFLTMTGIAKFLQNCIIFYSFFENYAMLMNERVEKLSFMCKIACFGRNEK